MNVKEKLYRVLVERHPDIKAVYQNYVTSNPTEHQKHRLRSWAFLLLLNLQRCILGKVVMQNQAPKSAPLRYPEYEIVKRLPVDELVEHLSQFDVISFDVFDTLLFRAVADPKDLFIVVGNRLKVIDFKAIRVEAEREAREKSAKPYREINIDDIYEFVQIKCGIDKDKAKDAEIQAERELCFANPYMLDVYRKLIARGKTIIAVSNMYLPGTVIMDLLHRNGYTEIQNVFVSCDYLYSKREGRLQKKVSEVIGQGSSYIHVGDNYAADYIGSRMAGWKSFYYKGANEIGKAYRPKGMSKLGGSIYSGLVNAKLHSGAGELDPYYELGYAYGGILACGYCAWLNQYAKTNNIEKFLFSGRDMYIVHEIYNKYYKELDNDYVKISRYAAQRFSFNRFLTYFINIHIQSRARLHKLTIGEALDETGLASLGKYLEQYELTPDTLFTTENYKEVKQCVLDHKAELLDEFQEEKDAAISYYLPYVKGCHNIGFVDLGWQGTNALCLKYLIEEESGEPVDIHSILVCAVGGEFLDHTISNGTTNVFCVSPQKNSNLISRFRHPALGRFLCELMFTSPEQSLRNFKLNRESGIVEATYLCNETRNQDELSSILDGIRDFAEDFNKLNLSTLDLRISGLDAILPLYQLTFNERYITTLIAENEVNPWIGKTPNRKP